jgi:glutamine synthetase
MLYLSKIATELNLTLKIATELEFYITKLLEDKEENAFIAKLIYNLTKNNLKIWEVAKEVAPAQYEVALQPDEVILAIENYKLLKNIITKTSQEFNTAALFEAKPFNNLPGCGLHIHIGIYDMQGNSQLNRVGEFANKTGESQTMLYAIGGLCETMIKNFSKFAPSEKSYERFNSKRNEISQDLNPMTAHNNAPTNVSWGGNNRTTAIRIPASTINENMRHIEHRVAGADANIEDVIEAILEGIYFGIKNQINPPEKIYGNAYDKQYSFLTPFPSYKA